MNNTSLWVIDYQGRVVPAQAASTLQPGTPEYNARMIALAESHGGMAGVRDTRQPGYMNITTPDPTEHMFYPEHLHDEIMRNAEAAQVSLDGVPQRPGIGYGS